MHVIEKDRRKHFYFKHASMVLYIFILVVFLVVALLNRPHLPPLPDPKREDEDMEGRTVNEEPDPLSQENLRLTFHGREFTECLAQQLWIALSGRFMLG